MTFILDTDKLFLQKLLTWEHRAQTEPLGVGQPEPQPSYCGLLGFLGLSLGLGTPRAGVPTHLAKYYLV